MRRGVEDSEAFAAAKKKSINEQLAVSVQTPSRSFDIVFVEPHMYPPVVTYLEIRKTHNETGEGEGGEERPFPFEDIIREDDEEEEGEEEDEDGASPDADAPVAPAGSA